jgi:hypothetical protein
VGGLIYNPLQRRWQDIDELRDENGDIVLETDDWLPWQTEWVGEDEIEEIVAELMRQYRNPQSSANETSASAAG